MILHSARKKRILTDANSGRYRPKTGAGKVCLNTTKMPHAADRTD
jgi:hypothetical protein